MKEIQKIESINLERKIGNYTILMKASFLCILGAITLILIR